MKSIIFVSEIIEDFKLAELEHLKVEASHNNFLQDISGFLYHDGRIFLQYFEGELSEVNKLLALIESDFRHEIKIKLEDSDIKERRFRNWNFKHIPKNQHFRVHFEDVLAERLAHLREGQIMFDEIAKQIWTSVGRLSRVYNSTGGGLHDHANRMR